jgi:hypothetical protein
VARAFDLAQRVENARFLGVLAESGNARLAARAVGRSHGTMHGRRAADAAFAQGWEAALAAAHARFHLAGGRRGPEREDKRAARRAARRGKSAGGGTGAERGGAGHRGTGAGAAPARRRGWIWRSRRSWRARAGAESGAAARARARGLRTGGGEAVVVRTRGGRLQLRLAAPGKLTRAAEQAFLSALSASANIRLSAAAAGASARAFYRRRERDPAFAREMRLALAMGYDRLECAALAAALPEDPESTAWRRGEPPPVARMSADQAIQLLALHEKSVRQGWEKPHRRKRRGESWDIHAQRMSAMGRAEMDRAAEADALARAARREATGGWRLAHEPPPAPLPPLELVTGWSRAKGGAPHHCGIALFGGWRIADMAARRREGRECRRGGAPSPGQGAAEPVAAGAAAAGEAAVAGEAAGAARVAAAGGAAEAGTVRLGAVRPGAARAGGVAEAGAGAAGEAAGAGAVRLGAARAGGAVEAGAARAGRAATAGEAAGAGAAAAGEAAAAGAVRLGAVRARVPAAGGAATTPAAVPYLAPLRANLAPPRANLVPPRAGGAARCALVTPQ